MDRSATCIGNAILDGVCHSAALVAVCLPRILIVPESCMRWSSRTKHCVASIMATHGLESDCVSPEETSSPSPWACGAREAAHVCMGDATRGVELVASQQRHAEPADHSLARGAWCARPHIPRHERGGPPRRRAVHPRRGRRGCEVAQVAGCTRQQRRRQWRRGRWRRSLGRRDRDDGAPTRGARVDFG